MEYIKSLYDRVAKRDDIAVISIATRPDCLSDEILSYLADLNKRKALWVELGLQTTKEESIKYIRRAYDTAVYDKAISDLNSLGIHTITHVILGLPGETKDDMLNTVKHVCLVGSKGIKLQLLHVLKGTDLEIDYNLGKFDVFSMDEYIDILIECLKIIPKNMVVHRITGDGPKKILIAPLWSGDKKKVLNTINKRLKEEGL